MLQTLWVLLNWEDWESFAIASIPFQLYIWVGSALTVLILRFRGRIPIFWASLLAGGVAGLVAAQVCMMSAPYALDYKAYRESVRQLEAQERLQRQRESPDVNAQPVELAGGMAGLESMKIFMALVSYRANSKPPRESDQQPKEKEFLQPQKTPQTVDVQSVSNSQKALGEVSDSSGRR
ncbi:hypothetical protein PFL02_01000 [Pseudomonas fluorescens]|uniref:hypothetical protein n=1 Tax=Pseudomonas protegens TaxID=380021 RepID=UPI001143C93E|nr:hypothetical protein [Pseudomonas protegens]GED73250.1 hypothetical protein PFL02_01000 [Pseudomonas fluorescens]